MKNRKLKLEKLKKKAIKKIINYYKEKTIKLQKKKQFELNKRGASIRKQSYSNKLKKQKEQIQKIESMLENIELSRFFELATTNKVYIISSTLHEIKNEILLNCEANFELIWSKLIGEIEQKTNIRFKNVDGFETYTNAIHNGCYDSDDVIFTGWFF